MYIALIIFLKRYLKQCFLLIILEFTLTYTGKHGLVFFLLKKNIKIIKIKSISIKVENVDDFVLV